MEPERTLSRFDQLGGDGQDGALESVNVRSMAYQHETMNAL